MKLRVDFFSRFVSKVVFFAFVTLVINVVTAFAGETGGITLDKVKNDRLLRSTVVVTANHTSDDPSNSAVNKPIIDKTGSTGSLSDKKVISKDKNEKAVTDATKGKPVTRSKSKAKVFVEEAGCFIECIIRNSSAELVAHCATQCANGDYATCASCLGLAGYIVVGCAVGCLIN